MSKSSSNIIFSNLITFQNVIETLCNLEIINSNYIYNDLYTDYVKTGSCNRFIINDIYDRNAYFTKNIYNSNLISSNISIIGYNDMPTLNINQLNSNQNIVEIYNDNNISFIITSNGNIAINKSGDIVEKVEINGNIKIAGNIYPSDDITYDLGTSNNRWKDLYLSGNSINLDNLVLSKNNSNNLELKDIDGKLKNININQLELNTGSNKLVFFLDNGGNLIFKKNDDNTFIYPSVFTNQSESSNSISSNVLVSFLTDTSNILNDKIVYINTDTIPLGIHNRFIIDDIYDRDVFITHNIITSNLTTSNLNVIGDTTVLNTTVYQTEQLQVINDTTATTMIIKQLSPYYNIAEFYNNQHQAVVINSIGNVGINNSNPLYTLDIDGNINCTSNLTISNLNVIGATTVLNTTVLLTEQFHLVNNTNAPSVVIEQLNENQNIAEFYNDQHQAVVISSNGNVGINNSNPLYTLDVDGNINCTNTIFTHNLITSNLNVVGDTTILNTTVYQTEQLQVINDTSATTMIIKQISQNYNIAEFYNDQHQAVVISSNGNVGINNSNPLYTLDVDGNINCTSNLTTSNLNVIGATTVLNTTVLLTEQFHLVNNTNAPSVVIEQLNENQNIAEFYNDQHQAVVISSNGNVGINNSNPLYTLDVNGNINCLNLYLENTNLNYILSNTSNKQYNYTLNTSNNINTNLVNSSNILNNKIIYINTDTIPLGANNRFITNDIYNRDATFTKNLFASNLIASNLSVIGDTTTLNTTVYQTEQLQVINDTTATSLIIKQMNTNQNVAEFYNNQELTLTINANCNIGIGKANPSYKLDVNGNINTSELFINNISINTTITNTSNNLFSFNNTTSNTLNTNITNTSNNLFSFNNATSNTLNTKINDTSTTLNTTITNTSNALNTQINDTSSTLNTTITTTSNNLIGFNNAASNALNTKINDTSSTLNTTITTTSNNLISFNNSNSNTLNVAITNTYDLLNNKINTISTNVNNNINNINTDIISIGNSNRFITNDVYDRDATFTRNLFTSNLITSNLNVIGDTTTLNTTVYQTEQLQVINDTTATSLIIKQMNTNQNVAEFYNNQELTLTINANCNIGIGKANPIYKLDVNGNINTSELFINNISINTTITNTSNNLISFNNATSNALNTKINDTSSTLNTTITTTSNNLISFNNATSNTLNTKINDTSSTLNTNITTTSNNLISFNNATSNALNTKINDTSSTLNTNITTTSNNLISFNNATSNALNTKINDTSTTLNTTITNTSNALNTKINDTSTTLNTTITTTSNNLIGFNNATSNTLNTKINDTSSTLNTTITTTSNNLISFNNATSNTLNTTITTTSNNLINYTNDTSNILNTKINAVTINTDSIIIGNSNRFITNDIYNRDATFTKNLFASNLIASNLSVIGDTTTLNTTVYQTEQLQVINDTTATSLIIKQMNTNQNVAEFYNNQELTLTINANCNIGIGKANPSYKLDVNGNINTSGLLINNISINTTITNTSNNLINFNNSNSNILNTAIINSSNNSINYSSNIINQSYCKKTTFYFTTATPYTYNGTTYYTYNIQLNKFVRYLQLNSNITLTKFRIHTALYDSYFNGGEIKESEYLIMMSDTTNGLSVRAMGTPVDTYLQKIQPWKIVKSSSFNHITYISPIQNAVILCTIIDEA